MRVSELNRNVNPFEQKFRAILKRAWDEGASDIHFENFEDCLRIRARIDGRLMLYSEDKEEQYRLRLAEVIKKACNFDMGIIGYPQDRRFKSEQLNCDFRASLCPTKNGEKVVLRLLERDKEFSLETYPLLPLAKEHLYKSLNKWQGIIIVSGPTGSGKTTLLYSALGALDRASDNVHTIEDPIEYSLPLLNQSEINKAEGLDFAAINRSLMRQDPDVILIGEVRDHETAESAIHAASTGHLVLTTVHANSAKEILARFEGLGVRRELLIANLLFASAQRLVPKLCPHCRVPDPDSSSLVEAVFGKKLTPFLGKGCVHCEGRGVKGRVLLFEWITLERDPSTSERIPVEHESLFDMAFEYLKKGEIDAKGACGLA